MAARDAGSESPTDDERWLVVGGRRWRRTDPALPADVVEQLKSHLGRGRSGVGAAKRRDEPDAVAASRTRVGLAKHGLGERGPAWWDEPVADRITRARDALAALAELDAHPDAEDVRLNGDESSATGSVHTRAARTEVATAAAERAERRDRD
ncbi:biopolymer transporter Tol [Herbiconiux oxytropis]|uniref:biopolymer transporter Tol n=1 Tax=Herbiconiux oxytropis TaxID=2970915 RepID=UPI0035C6A58B